MYEPNRTHIGSILQTSAQVKSHRRERAQMWAPFASFYFFIKFGHDFIRAPSFGAVAQCLKFHCIYYVFILFLIICHWILNATNKCNKHTNACFAHTTHNWHIHIYRKLLKKEARIVIVADIRERVCVCICFEMSQFPSQICAILGRCVFTFF